ncbi:hypothetical protein HCA93_03270 [Listeria innocua]|uniref:hypothetical protein n=1 Tax=Listeria innocua TaxID=1642 RepID=UPI00162933C9|nr:hypothetical protein [Listeria innocua]MBC2135329.1 hypothetical protein [Listeria innocua]
MTEDINATNFQQGLLDLSKATTDKTGTGGNIQELKQDFNLADALEELSKPQGIDR